MSIKEPVNLSRETTSGLEGLTDVMDEQISAQLLHGLARIERRLESIENRLSGGKPRKDEKPNVRNQLITLLHKGWVSEVEAIEKTGWQTIGVRSFVTKLKTLGLVVETEDRSGVPYYRIAK